LKEKKTSFLYLCTDGPTKKNSFPPINICIGYQLRYTVSSLFLCVFCFLLSVLFPIPRSNYSSMQRTGYASSSVGSLETFVAPTTARTAPIRLTPVPSLDECEPSYDLPTKTDPASHPPQKSPVHSSKLPGDRARSEAAAALKVGNMVHDPNNATPPSDFMNMLKQRMNVYFN
jgi:hypothetical protein